MNLAERTSDLTLSKYIRLSIQPQILITVEPAYNDIGLCDILAYSVRYSAVPINSSLLTITLYFSVITTLVYNDTKYSVPFMML
jgi:hypothetical protein